MALNPALARMVGSAKNKYSAGGDKAKRLKEGRNTIRLLVDPESTRDFWQDSAVHWIKATENGKPLVVLGDSEFVNQQPSLLNAMIDQAIESAMDEESKKLYESWRSKKSVILPVLLPPNDKPELIEVTTTTFGKIMEAIQLYLDAGEDITDPVSGKNLVITRTGTGLNTKYDVAVAPGAGMVVPPNTFKEMPDPAEYVQREFFRGEEQKALNAIAQITGLAAPRLTGPQNPATATAALTSTAATVEDAPAPVSDTPKVSPEEARRAELLKKQAEMQRELEELNGTTAHEVSKEIVQNEAKASEGTVDLDEDEMSAILADLDDLG